MDEQEIRQKTAGNRHRNSHGRVAVRSFPRKVNWKATRCYTASPWCSIVKGYSPDFFPGVKKQRIA